MSEGTTLRFAWIGLFATLSGAPVSAQQFHVPLSLPPHPEAIWRESEPAFLLSVGWSAARAAGLRVEGPGGFWEMAAPVNPRWSAHLRAAGFALSGRGDPAAIQRRSASGLSGSLGMFAAHSPAGHRKAAAVYFGMESNLTVLDFTTPGQITIQNGALKIEPNTAVSVAFGFPVGLLWRGSLSSRWLATAGIDAAAYAGGATFFTYGLGGPPAYGTSRRIDPFLDAGAKLGVEYIPWRLGLEAVGRVSSSSGNNMSVVSGYGFLTLGIF